MANIQWQLLRSWSPEFAWWLGVLYGDGNVYKGEKDYRVSVCGNLGTVSRWLQLIAPDRTAQEFKRSPGTFQGYLGSRDLVEWLHERYNLCGPKSHSLEWPEDCSKQFKRDFLRGLIDTDGSLSIWDRRANGQKGNPEMKLRYASVSKSFTTRVRDELELEGQAPRVSVLNQKNKLGKWNALSYSGISALRVATYLYESAPSHIRNDARYECYQAMQRQRDFLTNQQCSCGQPARREGLCQPCWWDRHGRKTGEGSVCSCGKEILAKGLCSACYSRQRRAGKEVVS